MLTHGSFIKAAIPTLQWAMMCTTNDTFALFMILQFLHNFQLMIM